MRLVRVLLVAAAGLTSLSACVGTDPQAGLRAGSGPALAAVEAPAPLALEASQRPVGVMPGELLVAPGRRLAGTDPEAVLQRSGTRVAQAAPHRGWAAARAARREDAAATAAPPQAPSRMPFMAARLTPGDAPAGLAAARPVVSAEPLTPLANVEARAAIEQQAQTQRDRRFDAQVRRASSLVCSGCLSGRGPARTRATAAEPDE